MANCEATMMSRSLDNKAAQQAYATKLQQARSD
jgi:hypothetical protein